MNHEEHHEPHRTHHHEIETTLDRPPLLSWGAILGALVGVISLSWLLQLLGIALGVSIADATDGDAVGTGLGIGAMVWVIVSALLVFFTGSMLAARLSGKVDSTVGMLHGLVLWGVASALILVMSYFGVTSLLQTGTAMVSTTASAVGAAASTTSSVVADAGSAMQSVANTELAENIQARLKRRAISVISRRASSEETELTEAEIREALQSLDGEAFSDIAADVVAGEKTSAAEALAEETNLSTSEVRSIIDEISARFEERIDSGDDDTALSEDIANSLQQQAADFLADLDAAGGADVTEENLEAAMEDLSPEVLQTVGMRLAQGNVQGAKDHLTNHTSLSRAQINDIVEGVNADVSRTIERYQEDAMEAVEAASTYTQAVLWTVFVASAMSLAVSLLGGMMGAETSRTLYLEERAVADREASNS